MSSLDFSSLTFTAVNVFQNWVLKIFETGSIEKQLREKQCICRYLCDFEANHNRWRK